MQCLGSPANVEGRLPEMVPRSRPKHRDQSFDRPPAYGKGSLKGPTERLRIGTTDRQTKRLRIGKLRPYGEATDRQYGKAKNAHTDRQLIDKNHTSRRPRVHEHRCYG